uniref:Uncharacterized protein n=1 Tax=Octopus bimaculoides TaxID=37653 RepID=A0A0L8IFQ9_OCTBM
MFYGLMNAVAPALKLHLMTVSMMLGRFNVFQRQNPYEKQQIP